jgi:uncharacterized membrane-anchored protein YhcB (DUF1043 family)
LLSRTRRHRYGEYGAVEVPCGQTEHRGNRKIMSQSAWILVTALLAFVAGGGLGFALAARRRGEADERAAAAEAELNTYRENVTGHFQETAVRFRELGEQYRSLHEHLAGGAQTLCQSPSDEPTLSFAPLPELEGPAVSAPPVGDDLPSMSAIDPESSVDPVIDSIESAAAGEVPPSPTGSGGGESAEAPVDLKGTPVAPEAAANADSDSTAENPDSGGAQAPPAKASTERTIH